MPSWQSALEAFRHTAATAAADDFWPWTLGAAVFGLICFFGGFWQLRRGRILEDTPTSKIRSAAQGYVELVGLARLLPGPDIISPLSGQRCCWWDYKIERQHSVWRNGRRTTEWEVIESGTSDELFLLVDPTGECIVDPEGATVVPSLSRQWRGSGHRPGPIPKRSPWFGFGRFRYTERQVQFGDALYAIGQFRTQQAQQAQDEEALLIALLSEWKRDQWTLKQRFDENRDGEIDLQEWETVRRAALQEVRAQHVDQALDTSLHVLSRPPDRRPFIVSTRTQHQLTRGFRLKGLLGVTLGIVLGGIALYALIARGVV